MFDQKYFKINFLIFLSQKIYFRLTLLNVDFGLRCLGTLPES